MFHHVPEKAGEHWRGPTARVSRVSMTTTTFFGWGGGEEFASAPNRAGDSSLLKQVSGRRICPLTVIGDGFRGPLIAAVVSALLVLGLPGVIDLQAAVELLPAGGEQLDVCAPEHDTHERE